MDMLSTEQYTLPRGEWKALFRDVSAALTQEQCDLLKKERRRLLSCVYQQRARKKRISTYEELCSRVKMYEAEAKTDAKGNIRKAVIQALQKCGDDVYDAADFMCFFGHALDESRPKKGSQEAALLDAVCMIEDEKESYGLTVVNWIATKLSSACKDEESVQWVEDAANEFLSCGGPSPKRARHA